MRLSPRLEALLSLLPPGVFLADVGSDHAYFPAEAIARGIVEKAVAIDDKEGPFAHMEATKERYGLDGRLFTRLADGLDGLLPGVDCLSLTGMGGRLILDILTRGKDLLASVKAILVDAHSERSLLQEGLIGLGYRPAEGHFLFDRGSHYSLERWEKGKMERTLAPFAKRFGYLPSLERSPDFLAYLKKEAVKREALLAKDGLDGGRRATLEGEREMIGRYLDENR